MIYYKPIQHRNAKNGSVEITPPVCDIYITDPRKVREDHKEIRAKCPTTDTDSTRNSHRC